SSGAEARIDEENGMRFPQSNWWKSRSLLRPRRQLGGQKTSGAGGNRSFGRQSTRAENHRARETGLADSPTTRHTTLPTSSATRSAPCPSIATPTGRPYASPSGLRNPDKTSLGSPTGDPFSKGMKITL